MAIHHLLSEALAANQVALSAQQQQKILRFLELLTTWNKVFNLTAITAPHDMVYLHIMDSLAVIPYLRGDTYLDIGSGAGLPGIPLAIAEPNKQWTLLDKNNKKTRFMTQACAELDLTNVRVIHARSEDFHPAQCFDSILSRAFGTLDTFAKAASHLLCPGGQLIAMKGKYPQEELEAIASRFLIDDVKRLAIKGTDIERHIVCFRQKD